MTHSIDVEQVALSQNGDLSRRRLAFVDKNRDLYVTPVQGAQVRIHSLTSPRRAHRPCPSWFHTFLE